VALMALKRTQERFALWVQIPGNVDGFFEALEALDPEAGKAVAFRDTCVKCDVPYTLMHAFVHGREDLKARYEAILAARADALVAEALEDVAEANDRDSAAAAKVKADTKLRIASKWDRGRYGEHIQVEKSVSVTADAGLLEGMGALLDVAKAKRSLRAPRLIEGESVPAAAPTAAPVAALPAASGKR
jgi:hypothetical protein